VGAIATIPRARIPVFGEAEPRHAADVELSPLGSSSRFPSLDADFAVQALIRRVFGVNEANGIAGATKTRLERLRRERTVQKVFAHVFTRELV
jgi:hypothetical protein